MGEDHFTKSNIVYKYHGGNNLQKVTLCTNIMGNNLQKVPILRNISMESVHII
jgi:hypothetical protein